MVLQETFYYHKKALRASKDNLAYFEKERVTLEANNLKQKARSRIGSQKIR